MKKLQLGVWNDPFNVAIWQHLNAVDFDISSAVDICCLKLQEILKGKWIILERENLDVFWSEEENFTPWEQRFADILDASRSQFDPISRKSMALLQIDKADITSSDEESWLELNETLVNHALVCASDITIQIERIVWEVEGIKLPITIPGIPKT